MPDARCPLKSPPGRRREAGRADLAANGSVFTALDDEPLDTGYVIRARSDATARIGGTGPGAVYWTGGDALEPVNRFQAKWFAWDCLLAKAVGHR